MKTRIYIAVLSIAVLVVAGCTSNPSKRETNRLLTPPSHEATSRIASRNTAIAGLLKQAEQLRSTHRSPEAIPVLERALRISPESAEVYYALSLNYRDLGNTEQARQMAGKGLMLATDPKTEQNLKALLTQETP